MKKYFIAIGLAVSALLLFGLYSHKQALHCQWYAQSAYVEVGKGLFVDPEISQVTKGTLLQQLHRGKSRVERTFGIMSSQPVIVISQDPKVLNHFAVSQHATTINSPLGQCIVIAIDGVNEDVFAHELVHSEFAHRIGKGYYSANLPVWFEEGVALTVDNREPFRRFNMKVSKATLNRVSQLSDQTEFKVALGSLENAQASKMLATQVLQRIHHKELYRRLERLAQGGDFNKTFATY